MIDSVSTVSHTRSGVNEVPAEASDHVPVFDGGDK